MALDQITSQAIADGAISAGDIADGSVTAAKLSSTAIADKLGYTPVSPTELNNVIGGAPGALDTLNELATALNNDASFATTVTNALATKAPLQQPTFTGQYINLPAGTTAQRPVSPVVGMVRYNTTTGSIEFYNGSSWIATNLIPVINSITGTIYVGAASTLTISLSNATDLVTVRFFKSGVSIYDMTSVSVSAGTATITVPSTVYSQTSGDVITISIVNGDGTPSSNSITKTAQALPTGGTITTYSNYRVHTFLSSDNFVVPSGFTAVCDVLLVAGGGGAGVGRNSGAWGGGGGAGGVIVSTPRTLTAGTYAVSIGAGGATGTQGVSSTFNGLTAIGGGYGGNGDATSVPTSWSIGGNGGSGGGGQGDTASSGGSGTAGQGYAGGTGYDPSPEHAGGGGGAGQAGYNGSSDTSGTSTSGRGGDGIANSYRTGSPQYYGGGGGGGWGTSSVQSQLTALGGGGRGGSGYAASLSATAGSANTGGGGGGGYNAQAGGSGIAVVRYQL